MACEYVLAKVRCAYRSEQSNHIKNRRLAAAFGFVDLLLLVLVEDLEVSAPAQQFFDCHSRPNFTKGKPQFFGYAKLKQQPTVFAKLGS